MNHFINFIESFKSKENNHIINSILEGYNLLFEGEADLDILAKTQSVFDRIINAIKNSKDYSDDYHDISVSFKPESLVIHEKDIPDITFGFEGDMSYFDEVNNKIYVLIKEPKTSYDEAYKNKDFNEISNIIKKCRSHFTHEFRHFLDTKVPGYRHKLPSRYILEKSTKLKELERRAHGFEKNEVIDEEKNVKQDIQYYNNQTERNAYLMQYAWNQIQKIIDDESVHWNFDTFIKELKDSYFFLHLTDKSKQGIIKRMYYIWDALLRSYDHLKKLDKEDLDQLFKQIKEPSNINENVAGLLIYKAEYALFKSGIIESEMDDDYYRDIKGIIGSQVDRSWGLKSYPY